MPETHRLERVRQLIRETFHRLGVAGSDSRRETVLIRNGHYCGHRFYDGDAVAIWFVEEDEVKFYGRGGGLLSVLSLSAAEFAAAAPRAA